MEYLRVLVVDDEFGMREGTARILAKHEHTLSDFHTDVGFKVETAADGAEALEKLKEDRWDVVLLDYKLPDMTGLDILEQIKALELDVVTVMITAYASLDVAVSATKNGAFDFLAKPFSPSELKTVIDKVSRSVMVHRHAVELDKQRHRIRFEFISVLAHELKAPLGIIESILHMAEDRILGDDLAKYDALTGRALARAESMRKMIQDLLDLTRIESGQRTRVTDDLDLVELAREAADGITESAQARKLRVNLHLPQILPFHGDRGELEIIFSNLLTNAVKYNRDGGRIDISVSAPEPGEAQIRISDTGIGMTAEETSRLFGEFVRIKNDKTRHIEGSGLGLSIVKKLSGLYDGEVSVSSKPDTGTTFTVKLSDGCTVGLVDVGSGA